MSLADRLEHIKRRLIHIAESSYKEKWISEEEYNNIRIKVDNEKITIGVVGQIKSGKSTFLNALIFGSEVLSTDVNPETATLTYIQYSNNPEAIVTFYNHEDIEEIKKFSKQSTIDFPEVSAAKKLMQAYQANKGEYENLIGSQKAVSLQKLKEYTSKNGKFIHLTKSVTLKFDSEKLRDVNIVDTPGFNDPVISRELITQSFLANSDVVIILLSALRPLDKTDRELIFDKIKSAGTGKVVIIINKYDELLDDVGTEEKVYTYVKKTFEDALLKDSLAYQEVLKDTKILLCSSIMALFGQLDKDTIFSDEDKKFHYDRLKDTIPKLETQQDFIQFSKIKAVEQTISNIIKEERFNILVHKTMSTILEKVAQKENFYKQELYETELEEKNLEKGKIEIENELEELHVFEERIGNKIKERVLFVDKYISQENLSIKNKILNLRDWFLGNIDEIIPQEEMLKLSRNYLTSCKLSIQVSLRKFYGEIREVMKDFQNNLHNKFESEVIHLEKNIDEEFKKIQYKSSEFFDLKKELIRVLKFFPYKTTHSNLEFDFTTFLIWGVKRNKIVEEATSQMELLTEDSKILAPFIELEKYINDEHLGKLEERFKKILVQPIQNSLENARTNLHRKHARREEILANREKTKKYLEVIQVKHQKLTKEFMELSDTL
ncbi:MAG: dynamin family protein [Leptospiraceae bacterium]|nr:dynamin family protein [Leptospiraceae bacterium]